ncbi:uncharacterized protein At1g27050-like [Silene latifolia]|uniref:uncharacterized protein At1g27050-like n=1 Tax=Silene latifolia TaxID=37657 RepID=UPI003D788ED7
MSRKREKPYFSPHQPYSNPKRRRPQPRAPSPEDKPQDKPAAPPALLVLGLPTGCSVLDLKSRFEIYGSISRIRINPLGVGSISFRTFSGADSAVAASLDPSFPISIDSHPVQVMWESDTKDDDAQDNVGERRKRNSNLSKLLNGETPLSRHGRVKRLSSAIVNPNATINSAVLDPPFKHNREIVAYDDIL